MKKAIICVLLTFLISGCWNVSYTDVSEQEKYKHLVGKKYEVVGTVYAYFVDESQRGIEPHISILAPPRISGPEIVSQDEIPIGSVLTVIKVERTNRIFECRTTLRLAPVKSLKENGIKYETRLEGMIGNQGEKCGELNPNYYREITHTAS